MGAGELSVSAARSSETGRLKVNRVNLRLKNNGKFDLLARVRVLMTSSRWPGGDDLRSPPLPPFLLEPGLTPPSRAPVLPLGDRSWRARSWLRSLHYPTAPCARQRPIRNAPHTWLLQCNLRPISRPGQAGQKNGLRAKPAKAGGRRADWRKYEASCPRGGILIGRPGAFWASEGRWPFATAGQDGGGTRPALETQFLPRCSSAAGAPRNAGRAACEGRQRGGNSSSSSASRRYGDGGMDTKQLPTRQTGLTGAEECPVPRKQMDHVVSAGSEVAGDAGRGRGHEHEAKG